MSDPSLKQDLSLSLKAVVLMGLVAAAIYLASWALNRVQGDEPSNDSTAATAELEGSPQDPSAREDTSVVVDEPTTHPASTKVTTATSVPPRDPGAQRHDEPAHPPRVMGETHRGEGSGAPSAAANHAAVGSTERVEQAGSRFRDAVSQAVDDAKPELAFCYRWQLENNPDLRGRIVMRFKVDGEGQVIEAIAAEGDLEDDVVRGCVSSVAHRMRFPPTGSEVSITYPIRFTPEPPEDAEPAADEPSGVPAVPAADSRTEDGEAARP